MYKVTAINHIRYKASALAHLRYNVSEYEEDTPTYVVSDITGAFVINSSGNLIIQG